MVTIVKKLFILFVFLSFCGSIGFSDNSDINDCYTEKYSFQDPLVQKYVDDYRTLAINFIAAFNENNLETVQSLADFNQEVTYKFSEVAERLTDIEEAQKFSKVLTDMATCFTNDMTLLMNRD